MSTNESTTTLSADDEFYGRIPSTLPTDDLCNAFTTPIIEKISAHLSDVSTETLVEAIRTVNTDEYDFVERRRFLAYNFVLNTRGIAPFWRDIPKHKYRQGMVYDEKAARYARDCQIVDLFWIQTAHPGHKANASAWGGMFSDFMSASDFSCDMANKIAHSELTSAVKVKALRLPPIIQQELCVLRDDRARKGMERVLEYGDDVTVSLYEAARRNPRRGKKTEAQIDEWAKIWMARRLVGDSITAISRTFKMMTGRDIHPSTLRQKIATIEGALREGF